MRRRLAPACLIAVVATASPAVAGSLDHAKVALHVVPVVAKNLCLPASQGGDAPDDRPCTAFVTSASYFGDYTVYVLAAQADSGMGFSGLSFGLAYDPDTLGVGLDVSRWTSCATTELPYDGPGGAWPAAGSGIRLGWDTCQASPPSGFPADGALAVAGALEVQLMTGNDLSVVANPYDPLGSGLWVVDCVGAPTALPPTSAARVVFSSSGTAPGYNPCVTTSPAECSIEPASIDYGTGYIPGVVDTPLVVSNLGGDVLADAMVIVSARGSDPSAFSVVADTAFFRIPPVSEITVPIRYHPRSGSSRAFVQFGTSCPKIPLTGSGTLGLAASPSILDFGAVPPEVATLDSVLITNACPRPLRGLLTLDDSPQMAIVRGDSVDLAPGESLWTVVSFRPVDPIPYTGHVRTEGVNVLTVKGTAAQICFSFPDTMVFPPTELDAVVDTVVSLVNQGPVTVSGSIPEGKTYAGGAFGFLSGTGSYALDPGDSLRVGVRFRPQVAGPASAKLPLGSPCGSLIVSGTGTDRCELKPAALHFGTVALGRTRDAVLHVYNRGPEDLEFDIPAPDKPEFTVVAGGGHVSLSPGEDHSAWFRFAPVREVWESSTLDLGLPCGPLVLDGYGSFTSPSPGPEPRFALHIARTAPRFPCVRPPVSASDPTPLPCSDFAVTDSSGVGREFTVYLTATSGTDLGVVGAGFGIAYNGDSGAGVDVSGWQSCAVLELPSDDWPGAGSGDVLAWDHDDRCAGGTARAAGTDDDLVVLGVFTVTATGHDLFRITPRTFADDPGPAIIACDLVSRVVPPSGWGSAGFSPAADLPGCNPCLAPCVEPGLWCAAVPGAVDFDSVRVDSAADRTIRVVNISSRELIGEIGSLPSPFAVLAGEGPFRLDPDAEHTVTVRFSPFETGAATASLAVGGSSPDVVVTGRGWEESPPGPEPSGPLAVRILAGANGSIQILVSGRVFGETGRAEIRIVDVRGRRVHTGMLAATTVGGYVWRGESPEGRPVPAGVYYLRVRSGNETAARSFVLLR
jgi:hypothetical protein